MAERKNKKRDEEQRGRLNSCSHGGAFTMLPALLEQSLACLGNSAPDRGIFGSIRFPSNLSSPPAKFMVIGLMQNANDAAETVAKEKVNSLSLGVIEDCFELCFFVAGSFAKRQTQWTF